MVKREKYLERIRSFYDSDVIKVITGIRRCGKSVILQSIIEEITVKSDNVIYLNFEKSDDFEKADNAKSLIKYVDDNRKDGMCYVFLDEVQEVENWQVAVKDLRLKNCSVFITGSNSRLLSGEFLTTLSGRFVSFRIRPFVYKEIAEYSKQTGVEVSPTDYLIWGGFPGRLTLNNEQAVKDYLYDVDATIIVNDLIKRYKIRKENVFKKIVNYILVDNSRKYSARKIYQYVRSQFNDISLTTVVKYIDYLKNAFIIDEIAQYSTKTKRQLNYYGKIYDADVALNSLRVENGRYDLDHNLENVVYNELVYMGYQVFTFDNKGKEIDFIASRNNKTFFVQVAYSVLDKKAYEREFSAFANLDNSVGKILITNDEIDYSTSTVRHIKFKDFLMLDRLDMTF